MGNPSDIFAHMATLRIQTQLKDPFYTFKGHVCVSADAGKWHDILVHPSPATCNHLETMCDDCSESWLTDHWVRIMAPDGAVLGINEVPGIDNVRDLHDRYHEESQ